MGLHDDGKTGGTLNSWGQYAKSGNIIFDVAGGGLGGSVVGKVAGRAIKSGIKNSAKTVAGEVKNKGIWTKTKQKSRVENAFSHYKNHKKDFPNVQNAKQYVTFAKNFITKPPKGTLMKKRPNGDKLFYNPKSNTFAIKRKGVPATIFKPRKGVEYWRKL
jgi:filamentous hemagglutinin